MPSNSAALLSVFSLLCTSVPAISQAAHTYVQLSEGSSGRIAIVNASPKTIEAFHFKTNCEGAGGFTHDLLDRPGQSEEPSPDNVKVRVRTYIIEPWGRLMMRSQIPPEWSKCEGRMELDAVLYTDGTHEGDDTELRKIQARRDGIADALKYWTDRFAREQTGPANYEVTLADSEKIPAQDFPHMKLPGCLQSPLACAYWSGRRQVDMDVAVSGKSDKDSPAQRYDRMFQEVNGWQIKLNEDVALKVLDPKFVLPSEIAASADKQTKVAPWRTP
jgi:hypothetical protein